MCHLSGLIQRNDLTCILVVVSSASFALSVSALCRYLSSKKYFFEVQTIPVMFLGVLLE